MGKPDAIALLKAADKVMLLMPDHWARQGTARSCDTDGVVQGGDVTVYSSFKPHHPSCPPCVLACAGEGAFSWMGRLQPDQARLLAAALLKAADVVEPMLAQWQSIVNGEAQPCSSQ